MFLKRTFELLSKHGPMGDPIKIPVYRGNTKVDLIFYLFTRIGICDGPAREKLG